MNGDNINASEIIRINVHKSLAEEFRIRKEIYEKAINYKINGGTPVVSELCARILAKQRTMKIGDPEKIVIEIRKIKGQKKIQTLFL